MNVWKPSTQVRKKTCQYRLGNMDIKLVNKILLFFNKTIRKPDNKVGDERLVGT